MAIGTLESDYADRLVPGTGWCLTAAACKVHRREGQLIHARGVAVNLACRSGTRPATSLDRAGTEVAGSGPRERDKLSQGRRGSAHCESARMRKPDVTPHWPDRGFAGNERTSEVPRMTDLLVEQFPRRAGLATLPFTRTLNRRGVRRRTSAGRSPPRLGRQFGRDLSLQAADLGWSIRMPADAEAGARPD